MDIDLHMAPQGEPVHFLACANVAEYRFYNAQSFAVSAASIGCVNLLLGRFAGRVDLRDALHISTFASSRSRKKTKPRSPCEKRGLSILVHGTLFVGVDDLKEQAEIHYHNWAFLSRILNGNKS